MPPEAAAGEAPPQARLDRWILPFFRDPTLWPVLLVVIGHVAAFVAPLLLMAIRDGRLGAWLALAALVAGSGAAAASESRRFGRPGAVTGALLLTWLLSAGCAWLAHRYEVF